MSLEAQLRHALYIVNLKVTRTGPRQIAWKEAWPRSYLETFWLAWTRPYFP